MLASLGAGGSGGLMAGIIFAFSWLPIVLLQLKGQAWREKKARVAAQSAGPEKGVVPPII